MSRQRTMEAILASEYVTIGELVRLTDTRYSTLKYYTEEGLLPFQQGEANLTRRYPREASVERIRQLKALRAEGRSIPQLKDLFHAEEPPLPPAAPPRPQEAAEREEGQRLPLRPAAQLK